jgi:hypothetical protein
LQILGAQYSAHHSWNRVRARRLSGGWLPVSLFRLRGGFTTLRWSRFPRRPIIPDNRISRVQFEPLAYLSWVFPNWRGLSAAHGFPFWSPQSANIIHPVASSRVNLAGASIPRSSPVVSARPDCPSPRASTPELPWRRSNLSDIAPSFPSLGPIFLLLPRASTILRAPAQHGYAPQHRCEPPLRQCQSPPPKIAQVVSHQAQRQPHFVRTESMTRPGGHLDGLLPLRRSIARVFPACCRTNEKRLADILFTPKHT